MHKDIIQGNYDAFDAMHGRTSPLKNVSTSYKASASPERHASIAQKVNEIEDLKAEFNARRNDSTFLASTQNATNVKDFDENEMTQYTVHQETGQPMNITSKTTIKSSSGYKQDPKRIKKVTARKTTTTNGGTTTMTTANGGVTTTTTT